MAREPLRNLLYYIIAYREGVREREREGEREREREWEGEGERERERGGEGERGPRIMRGAHSALPALSDL